LCYKHKYYDYMRAATLTECEQMSLAEETFEAKKKKEGNC